MAVKFDSYDGLGEGNYSIGVFTNGNHPSVPSSDLTPTGINLHSGDPFCVSIIYDGHILRAVLTDTEKKTSATQRYKINIPSTIGSTKAFVGFTGGTGENHAIQEIHSWPFSSSTTPQEGERHQ